MYVLLKSIDFFFLLNLIDDISSRYFTLCEPRQGFIHSKIIEILSTFKCASLQKIIKADFFFITLFYPCIVCILQLRDVIFNCVCGVITVILFLVSVHRPMQVDLHVSVFNYLTLGLF